MAFSFYHQLLIFAVLTPAFTQTTDPKGTSNLRPSQLNIQENETSKWFTYEGCSLWSFNQLDTLTKVKEKFRFYYDFLKENQTRSFTTNDLNDCALRCSSHVHMEYMVYLKTICHCSVSLALEGNLDDSKCMNTCRKSTEIYCGSGVGAMVFRLHETYQWEDIPPYVLSTFFKTYSYDWYCIRGDNGQYINQKDCKKTLIGLKSTVYCTHADKIFVVLHNGYIIQWECFQQEVTRRFRIIKRTLIKEQQQNGTTEGLKETTHFIKEHTSGNNFKINDCRIVDTWYYISLSGFGGFLLVILVLVVVIYYLVRKLRKLSYTNLTIGRDQHTYSGLPQLSNENDGYTEVIDLPQLPVEQRVVNSVA